MNILLGPQLRSFGAKKRAPEDDNVVLNLADARVHYRMPQFLSVGGPPPFAKDAQGKPKAVGTKTLSCQKVRLTVNRKVLLGSK